MKQVSIKNPCHKKWSDLKGGEGKRFCESCSKDIIDLTQKSNTEIVELVMKTKGRLCGRIRKDQVDSVIHQSSKNSNLSKFMFFFLIGFAQVSNVQATEHSYNQMVKVLDVETDVNQIQSNIRTHNQDSLIKISGRVIDKNDSSGIPSVRIKLKTTEISFKSDINGYFSFEMTQKQLKASKRTLEFFFLGYKTQEVIITEDLTSPLTIKMEPEAIILGEIRIPWHKRFWRTITSPFRNKS